MRKNQSNIKKMLNRLYTKRIKKKMRLKRWRKLKSRSKRRSLRRKKGSGRKGFRKR